MKNIANTPRQTSAKAVFLASALATCLAVCLGGCALPLPDKPQRPQPYDLGPPPVPAAAASAPAAAVAMDNVQSAVALDGTAIIYRLMYSEDGMQPRPYAHARWSMSPPQLLTQRLRQALAATRPVVEPGAGLAPLELRAELDEFAHVFASPDASEGVVRLRVTVFAPAQKNQRLLGQRSFAVRQPAPTPDAAGGVAALRAATDEAVAQVVQWLGALPSP